MRTRARASFAITAVALAVTGCEAPPVISGYDYVFGNALRQDVAMQAVNPYPAAAGESIDSTGQVIEGAYQRYLKDKVKKPYLAPTSDFSTAGGGGGGDGGGGGGASGTGGAGTGY